MCWICIVIRDNASIQSLTFWCCPLLFSFHWCMSRSIWDCVSRFSQCSIPHFVFLSLRSLHLSPGFDIFCVCFFIVVPSFRCKGSLSSSDSLFDIIFDPRWIVDCALVFWDVSSIASLILFFKLLNVCASSVLTIIIISCLNVWSQVQPQFHRNLFFLNYNYISLKIYLPFLFLLRIAWIDYPNFIFNL